MGGVSGVAAVVLEVLKIKRIVLMATNRVKNYLHLDQWVASPKKLTSFKGQCPDRVPCQL